MSVGWFWVYLCRIYIMWHFFKKKNFHYAWCCYADVFILFSWHNFFVPRRIVMICLTPWLKSYNVYACTCTSDHTHIHWISLLNLLPPTHTQNTPLTLDKDKPIQKPILTLLTGTEVGHPFSTLHVFIFYSAQSSRTFHRKAHTTFGMCFSASIFISHCDPNHRASLFNHIL